jgi:hypothetical protein
MQAPFRWTVIAWIFGALAVFFLASIWPLRTLRWHHPEYACFEGRHRMKTEQQRVAWIGNLEIWSYPMIWDCNEWYRVPLDSKKNATDINLPPGSSYTQPSAPRDTYK